MILDYTNIIVTTTTTTKRIMPPLHLIPDRAPHLSILLLPHSPRQTTTTRLHKYPNTQPHNHTNTQSTNTQIHTIQIQPPPLSGKKYNSPHTVNFHTPPPTPPPRYVSLGFKFPGIFSTSSYGFQHRYSGMTPFDFPSPPRQLVPAIKAQSSVVEVDRGGDYKVR